MRRPDQKDRACRGTVEWALHHAPNTLAAATLIGLLLYAAALHAADLFYGVFSLRPEEVGLTYPGILSRAGYSAFFLMAALLIAGTVGYGLAAMIPIGRPDGQPWLPNIGRRARVVLVGIALIGTGTGILLGYDYISSVARRSALSVAHGREVTPLVLRFFPMSARRVHVRWLDPSVDKQFHQVTQLLWLGSADGVDVFYHPARGAIRVSADKVLVTWP